MMMMLNNLNNKSVITTPLFKNVFYVNTNDSYKKGFHKSSTYYNNTYNKNPFIKNINENSPLSFSNDEANSGEMNNKLIHSIKDPINTSLVRNKLDNNILRSKIANLKLVSSIKNTNTQGLPVYKINPLLENKDDLSHSYSNIEETIIISNNNNNINILDNSTLDVLSNDRHLPNPLNSLPVTPNNKLDNSSNKSIDLTSISSNPNIVIEDKFNEDKFNGVTGLTKEKESNIFTYLNDHNKFNNKLAMSKYIMSPFNKSFPFSKLNLKQRRTMESLPFKLAEKLIKLTFLSIGIFISKPVFNIYYNNSENIPTNITKDNKTIVNNNRKILIQLFYYVKSPRYRSFLNFIPYYNNNNIIKVNENKESDLNNNNHYTLLEPSIIKELEVVSQYSDSSLVVRNNILVTFNNKCEYLLKVLGKILKSDIELECVRLNKSYFDSNILVQDIAMKSYSNRFVKLTRKLFKKSNTINPNKVYNFNPTDLNHFPSYLSGIYIKLAGRSFKQRIIPRMTVKNAQKGTLTNINVNLLQKSRFTGKTRRGSFSFTVVLAHLMKP